MASAQLTLEGEETDAERQRPSIFRYCSGCDEEVLATRWDEHEDHHDPDDPQVRLRNEADKDLDDKDFKPDVVGSWFTVRIHKTVEYAFNVPAYEKHRAKELAEEWSWDAKPADSYTVHTEVDERKEITTEDVPDDWDPYGDVELWEVFDGE